MIIWSGRGIVALLVLVGFIFIAVRLPASWNEEEFLTAVSLILTGVFSWIMGIKWNIEQAKVELNTRTGKPESTKNKHTLFWIPMQYWGFIFPVLGTLLFFSNGYILAAIGSGLGLALVTYLIWKAPSGDLEVKPSEPKVPTNRTEQLSVQASTSTISSQVEQQKPVAETSASPSKKEKTLADMTEEERQAYFQQYMPK